MSDQDAAAPQDGQEQPKPDSAPASASESKSGAGKKKETDKEKHKRHHCVLVRGYPKIIYMYPSLIVALICGIFSMWWYPSDKMWEKGSYELAGDVSAAAASTDVSTASAVAPVKPADSTDAGDKGSEEASDKVAWYVQEFQFARMRVLGMIFMILLMLNFLTITTEFNRHMTLVVVMFIAFMIVGAMLLNQQYPEWQLLSGISEVFRSMNFVMNSHFYFGFSIILLVMMLWTFVDSRFDYWEIKPNEILHHFGFLGDVRRYPTRGLKMNKEITDVFEFLLLRSGRLILHPSTEKWAIVLDNVIGVNRIEARIQEILESLSVTIEPSGQ